MPKKKRSLDLDERKRQLEETKQRLRLQQEARTIICKVFGALMKVINEHRTMSINNTH